MTAPSTVIAGCGLPDPGTEHTNPTVTHDDHDNGKYLEFRGDNTEFAVVGVAPNIDPTPSSFFIPITLKMPVYSHSQRQHEGSQRLRPWVADPLMIRSSRAASERESIIEPELIGPKAGTLARRVGCQRPKRCRVEIYQRSKRRRRYDGPRSIRRGRPGR